MEQKERIALFIDLDNLVGFCLDDGLPIDIKGEIKKLDSPENLKLEYGKRTLEVRTYGSNEPIIFDLNQLKDDKSFLELVQSGEIKTIHSKEANLNDIFIATTA